MTRPDSVLLIPASAVVIGLVMILSQSCGPRFEGGDGYHQNYELIGMHVGVTCESCHPAEQGLGPVPLECESCHEEDRPTSHYSGGCAECHTELGWGEGVSHDHILPLVDAHDIECAACHVDPDVTLEPVCSSCHEGVRPVEHFEGTDCAGCHEPTKWEDARVDHSFFPLTGKHDQPCTTCHVEDGVFTGLDKACTSCHESDRPEDHHGTRDCVDCHAPTAWEDAVDHDFFALADGHALECDSCHVGFDFETALDPTCSSCHETDHAYHDQFDARECSDCHAITTWTDHTFDHALFETKTCDACHERDRPTDHFVDKTDCGECHPTTRWEDGTFDHTPYFPVPHRDAKVCGDCHLDEPAYNTFSCIDCHDHRKSKMDEVHKEEGRDYKWDSAFCVDCHPKGKH